MFVTVVFFAVQAIHLHVPEDDMPDLDVQDEQGTQTVPGPKIIFS